MMNHTPIISVIIPIYKAEDYLIRCLESISKQTFKDFEVILVDDGSPDRSGGICDDYCLKDNRFCVVHKENGGVSSARQIGVELARGIYSIQFDPDDWVEEEMLQLLYEKALEENSDIVVCDMYMDYCSSSKIVTHHNRPSNLDLLFDEFLTGRFPASLANKLIRHGLYKEKNFKFNPKISRWEDTHAVCTLMYGLNHISFVDVPLYHYDFHSNPNSLARNVNQYSLNSQMLVCDYFSQLFQGTIHEAAVDCMRKSTKALAYNVLNSSEYVKLYNGYNKEVWQQGILGKLGISGFFMAFTILSQCDFPQYIYHKLQCYCNK